MRTLTPAALPAALACLALAACATAAPDASPKADLVIWGGPIHTGVDGAAEAQAVAVREGRIAYVGARAGAQAQVGPNTRVVDLRGAALFPGFTDGHAHLRGVGERELSLNLEGAKSAAEAAGRVRAHLEARPGAGPVWGRGWIETGWPEGRFLDRKDIDPFTADRPVLLVRADGHALVANSAALKAAGVDETTKAPPGGEILKDKDGRLTGMLVDNAMALVAKLQQPQNEAEKRAAYAAAFKVETAYGWTGVHNMSVDWADVALLEDLAAKGQAPLRVYNAVDAAEASPLFESGPRQSPDGRITTRTVKIYADGALGSRGAALFEPYADAHSTSGLIRTPPEQMKAQMTAAYASGVQVATHAIGDRGNAVVLDLYEQVFAATPPNVRMRAPRWRIEHAQILRPADIARFPRDAVIASMQPSHAIGDLHFAPARLGDRRLDGAYAWKSLVEAGAVVVGGSDAPVERGDPLIEFYAAVARKDLQGFATPAWRPAEALSRAEALKLFTRNAAFARFAEDELGTIEPGKRADLTAFSVDLMTAPEAEIPKGHAVLTVVDGEVVYERRRAEP
ncbi:amidohydrolase [Phenylobacterium sp. VNQ135]|uniref:amidohydrolase n=1 Tax=Phenylobacterium sp. VNQ135 TaxID=3400922 RepID=UPI003BFDD189